MALLGNIIWLVLGGWVVFLFYTLSAIVFFPAFIPLWRLAKYAAWPFGKDVLSQWQLNKYRDLIGSEQFESDAKVVLRHTSTAMNIIWMLTFGWLLALMHLIASILNLIFIFLIITIPNISAHWKLIPTALMPFNKVVLPKEIAADVRMSLARAKHGI